jgi:1-deoxy-D-xylulose-5-phosphate reductoisomerase
MGPKITIDSATLMNKGLEVIEAHWLFAMPPDRINVLVHPQSIVHSMVELSDGAMIAQLGITDMRLPIQYAFSFPDRWPSALPSLDLTRAERLEFQPPNAAMFPCLRLAYHALQGGGGLPVLLNASNEVAVDAFLERRLGFAGIPRVIEAALDAHSGSSDHVATIEDVRVIDRWAREYAQHLVGRLQSSYGQSDRSGH